MRVIDGSSQASFLPGGGEMARLIREHDWTASLGKPGDWPPSLKTTMGLMLHSPVPLVLLWGEDGIMLYNDAYSKFAGNRHPRLLGSKVREGWPEVADFNDNVMKVGLAGGTLSYKAQELTLNRSGKFEPAWLNLDYSPVIDESGKPAGVIAIVVEITDQVLAERRVVAEHDRLRQMFEQGPSFMAMLNGPEHRFEFVNTVYQQLTGGRDLIGKPVQEALPDAVEQGYLALLDQVFKTGQAFRSNGAKYSVQVVPGGPVDERFVDFVFQPVTDSHGQITGIFVEGVDVTEHVAANEAIREGEIALRSSSERLRLATEAAQIGTWDFDPRSGALNWDTRCKALFGLPSDAEITYDVFLAGLHPDDRETTDQAVQQAFDPDGSGVYNVEYRTLGLVDGVERCIAATGRARFEDRQPVRFTGTVMDISAQKKAENLLRESDAKFQSFAQAMPNHVWSASPDGQLDWFNNQTFLYSGLAFADLEGQHWVSIVHPDDLPSAAARWAEALADGEIYETEFRVRRADGVYRWHIARAMPIKDNAGHVTRWVGTNTDIHDQRQTAEALRQLNAELEAKVLANSLARGRTWQLSPDLIGVLNADGYFETSNPAWETILGWTETEVASTVFFDFIHPDDQARTQAAWEAAMERGEPALRFENRYRCKDGSYRWLSWVAVPDEGKVYCSARDITADKEREAQLVQTEEALRQSQKMEAVGQLTGGIAHDFNNLLQGITGALDRVQNRLAQGRANDVERFLKAAIDSANRAAALTHRLLAFSRRQTLDPRAIDANRLIAGMEDLVRRTVGPNVAFEVVGAGGLWPIRVDPSQLENALLNLCINARDAMPSGGRLTIETANKWLDERAAQGRDIPPGQYVSLCVTDTGSGMTPEVIARAFDPFFTTKPMGQGTGLGLSMIYGFVRQSGGQVRIYSEMGKGTTMCLYFPRHMGEADTDSAPASEMMERGFGETVLVVDDEPTVRMLVAEVLSESYYNIVEAVDGPAALKILQTSRRIDLMITDVGLPGGMNGRQVADAARVARPGLKVLFITGYAENAAVGNGHLDAGMEILAKPFAMSTLANKVREMIER